MVETTLDSGMIDDLMVPKSGTLNQTGWNLIDNGMNHTNMMVAHGQNL